MISSIGKITEASTVVAAGAPHTLAPELRIVVGMPAGKLTSLHKEDLDPQQQDSQADKQNSGKYYNQCHKYLCQCKSNTKVQKLL
jgi:hypothetical protein